MFSGHITRTRVLVTTHIVPVRSFEYTRSEIICVKTLSSAGTVPDKLFDER